MLRLFVPNAVEGAFFNIARQTSTDLNWLTFATLVALFCLVLAWILRSILLRVDAHMAVASRLKDIEPGPHIFATGYVAVWLPRVMAVVLICVIAAEGVILLDRAEDIDLPNGLFDAARGFAAWGWR